MSISYSCNYMYMYHYNEYMYMHNGIQWAGVTADTIGTQLTVLIAGVTLIEE